MKRFALFAVQLVLLTAETSSARQASNVTVANAGQSSLTPRENALNRGDILMARKEYALAAETYQQALLNDPKDAPLLNKIGIAYQQLSEYDRADHFYKKAMKADKTFSSAINNLGTLEYQRKRYGKSIKYYKKALEREVSVAALYSNLGYSYYANKQYPQAMESFGKALALDPDVFTHRGSVGTILQQRTAPDPGLFNFLLAKFYAKSGDAEHAAHYLKVARDDGYKEFASAEKDPEFASVIKDPRVQEVLQVPPSYANDPGKTVSN